MSGKNKKKLDYDLKVGEALEIKKANCGPGKGMNEDWGSYVKTDAWNPVFNTMDWQLTLYAGRGAQPFLGFWSLTTVSYPLTSLSNPQLSHFPLYKPFLSLCLSVSDDDSQSGSRKFRQNCCFFANLHCISIMKINHVLNIFFCGSRVRTLGVFILFQ